MIELTPDQQAAVLAGDRDLLLRGPPVSGRTTTLLQIGERIMDRQTLFASKVWCVSSSPRASLLWRAAVGRHHALSGAEIIEPARWLRDVWSAAFSEADSAPGTPWQYARAAEHRSALEALALPRRLLEALDLLAEGDPQSLTKPTYPPNDYSPTYRATVGRLTAEYESHKRKLDDLGKYLEDVLEGRPVTRQDHLLWACIRLYQGRGEGLKTALTSRFGLMLVDDLEAFTPLERVFLRLLVQGTGIRLAVTAPLATAPDPVGLWQERLGRPLETRHLEERFNRPEILLFARALTEQTTTTWWPARGPGGQVSPAEHVFVSELPSQIRPRIDQATRAGRTLAILTPAEFSTLYPNLRTGLPTLERWVPDRWPFEATLIAALRCACGLSSPTGGHPLLEPAWQVRQHAAEAPRWLSKSERAELHELWRKGKDPRGSCPLHHVTAALRTCRTTGEVGEVVLAQHAADQDLSAELRDFMSAFPDPVEALAMLTARAAVPRPVFATLTEARGHWDEVVLLLPARLPDLAEVLKGILAATERLHLLTFGQGPLRDAHPTSVEHRTRPERTATLQLLAQEDPPTSAELQVLLTDPLTRHLYHRWWPLNVPTARREAWAERYGELDTWADLGPSRAWEKKVTLLDDWGLR